VRKILVTQRVDIHPSYGERRDALDQRWIALCNAVGLWPTVAPNNLELVRGLVVTTDFDGILFTGGNTLHNYGGDAPERDELERFLLSWSIKKAIPALGVCRGMQLIQDYFGNQLSPVTDHVDAYHELSVRENCRLSSEIKNLGLVNSYHHLGSTAVGGGLIAIARAKDGVVEAVEHRLRPIYGVMWHSEREAPLKEAELALFKKIFKE
jgi:putative glutamine amidotransferase